MSAAPQDPHQDSYQELPGFAADDDTPIPYMARTRDYYQAIGYTTPYRWAHYVDAPFQPLRKPLDRSRVAIITTAAPFDPLKGEQGPGAAYNSSAKFYSVYDGDMSGAHDLRISHIAYDRVHSSAEDSNAWFPLRQIWLRAFSARRPIAATVLPWIPTRRTSSRVAGKTPSMRRCWCRTVRSAIRPSVWSPGIWKPTASPPW
jgi:D-proline reductase (dithiol) PrdB